MNNLHLGLIYSAIISTIGTLTWLDGRYAHAEDIDRIVQQKEVHFTSAIQELNTSLTWQTEKLGLDVKQSINEVRLMQYAEKIDSGKELTTLQQRDFDYLIEEKQRLIERQDRLNMRK